MIPPDLNSEQIQDEIIAEVRAIRDSMAAEFGYDVELLFDEVKRLERMSARPKLAPAPKLLSTASRS